MDKLLNIPLVARMESTGRREGRPQPSARPLRSPEAEAPGHRDRTAASSETLAAWSIAGDPEAFACLVVRHTDRLFNFLHRWTGNRQDAEDLTQETFIQAFRSIGRYRPSHAFLPWLFTIARRTAIGHWRSGQARREPADPAPEPWTEEDPSVRLAASEEQASLWRLARRLKPKQFEALWLCYGEGFRVQEVARILGTNSIHAKVLLHRARTQMARWLQGTDLQASLRPQANRPSPPLKWPPTDRILC